MRTVTRTRDRRTARRAAKVSAPVWVDEVGFQQKQRRFDPGDAYVVLGLGAILFYILWST
jgi:hypothetical protein